MICMKSFLTKKYFFKTLFYCLLGNRQNPGLNCAVPVMLFTLEHVRTPAPPSWTLFSMSPAMETCYHQQNRSLNTVAPHKGPRFGRETNMGQNCNTYSGVIMLNLNMCFIRLNFPASPHLRHPSLLTLSSRCCRIWWVKQWRRQMGSIQ